MSSRLKSYAVNFIGNALNFDKQTCQEIVDYSLTLESSQDVQTYFFNLLGETDEVFKFVETYFSLKQEDEKSSTRARSAKNIEKTKNPDKSGVWGQSVPEGPKQPRGRLAHKNTSTTTSELINIKPSNQLSASQAKKSKKKNLNNLKDVEAALHDLEAATRKDEILRGITRRCNCMATKHPLFDVAPNCLNCGKIICEKEGLQPCSFCGHELLSNKDKQEIMAILQQERDDAERKLDSPRDKAIQQQESPALRKKKIVVQMKAGENMWKAQDRALKQAEEARRKEKQKTEAESQLQRDIDAQEKELKKYAAERDVDAELLSAQNRLESLLNFQKTGAERTKIIDNAADFEAPSLSNSGSIWLSPVERALHLKKQQRNLRKYEQAEANRRGRGKKAVEMVIKDGKVTMVEKWVAGDDEETPPPDDVENRVAAKPDTEVRQYWDYENDHARWEKPQYMPRGEVGPDTIEMEPVEPMKHRVQFAKRADDELVAMIPS